jgi:hypothetical protein
MTMTTVARDATVAIGICLLIMAGWITHLIATIGSGDWLFLILGALLWPLGTVHGWGVWLGLW